MDDLISRQDAIDMAKKLLDYYGTNDISKEFADHTAERFMNWVPSAQPEPITVNIDHELTQEEYEKLRKDMANAPIMLLPSAQQWIPCSERLPGKGMRAVLLYSNEKISGGVYMGDRVWDVDYNDTDLSVYIIAWMPRPEQYKGEE